MHPSACLDLLHGADSVPCHAQPIARHRLGLSPESALSNLRRIEHHRIAFERRSTCHRDLIDQQGADGNSVLAHHQKIRR
jgi:hypothetical protein